MRGASTHRGKVDALESAQRELREQLAALQRENSERERAEAAQTRLAAILEATPDIVGSADPDGGRAIAQAGTVTLRLGDFGAVRTPTQSVLNLKASRRLSLGGSRRIDVSVDLFNALNANTATAVTYASGPTYGAITADGRFLYVANEESDNVSKVDTETNQRLNRSAVGSDPANLAILGGE